LSRNTVSEIGAPLAEAVFTLGNSAAVTPAGDPAGKEVQPGFLTAIVEGNPPPEHRPANNPSTSGRRRAVEVAMDRHGFALFPALHRAHVPLHIGCNILPGVQSVRGSFVQRLLG